MFVCFLSIDQTQTVLRPSRVFSGSQIRNNSTYRREIKTHKTLKNMNAFLKFGVEQNNVQINVQRNLYAFDKSTNGQTVV